MKKITLIFAALLFFVGAAFAQQTKALKTPLLSQQATLAIQGNDDNGMLKSTLPQEQGGTRAAPIFSESFEGTTGGDSNAGGPLPTGWTSIPTTGIAGVDRWGTSGGSVAGVNGNVPAHGGSRFAYIAWPNAPNDAWMISPAIALTAGTSYLIEFWVIMQGFDWYEELEVRIGNANTASAMTTLLWSSYTDDYVTWTRQTAMFTPTTSGNFYLGFYSTSDDQMFTAIDDIAVSEAPNNDISVTACYPYTQVPVSQTLATTHSGKVTNEGLLPQTNIVFSAAFNGTTLGSSAPHPSLAPGASVTLSATSSALPIPLGDNTLTYTATQTETDENPANNTHTEILVGTQNTYAVDDGTVTWNIGNSSPITLGNIYTITNEAELNRVMLRFSASTPTSFTVSLYAMNGNAVVTPALFTQNATKTTAAGWVTVSVPATTLTPGNYYICANQTTTTNFALNADGNPNRLGYRLVGTALTDLNATYGAVIGAPFVRMLVDLPDNDIQIVASNPLLPYNKIPASQAPANAYGGMMPFPATLTAQAFNAGISAQTGIVFSATFNGSAMGTSNTIATLAPNATSAAMNITAPTGLFYPYAQGNYNFVYTVTQNEQDVNPADNNATFTLEIGNKYQLDDITVISNGVGNNDATITAGNIFNIYHPTTLTQVELGHMNGGQPYTLSLFRLNGTTIDGAAIFTTQSATSVAGFSTISVPPTELTPGDYYLCINQTGTTNISLAYDTRANARRLYTKTLAGGAGTVLTAQTTFGAGAIRMIVEDNDIPTHAIITTEVTPAGTGTVTGGGTYAIGVAVSLEAIPEPGFVFARWDDGITTNPRTLLAFADVTFTAIFRDESCGDYSVGAGTTTGYTMPVNTYYNYSYVQHLYEASEIDYLEPGLINAISFQYSFATPNPKNPITIYLGNTTKTTFASTTDWVPLADMQQVFTGAVNFNNTNSWFTISFDEPFVYTGCNLAVAVVNNNGAYTTGSSATFRYTALTPSTNYKTLLYYSDTPTGGSIDPFNNSYTASSRTVNRSNTQFEICAGQPEIVDLAALSINGPYKVAPGETYNYTVAVKNQGTVIAQSYVVKVADEDGAVLGQVTVTEPLELCNPEEVIVPVTIPADASYAYIINLKGIVEAVGDDNTENDETPLYKVNVLDDILVNLTIGASTTTNGNIPFLFNNSSSIAQSIYLRTEIDIAEGNKIYALSYNYQTTGGAALPEKPLKVYLAHTELNTLAAWIPMAEFTQVFEGVAIVQNTPSPDIYELIFILDEPFVYQGGHLCVMTEHPMFAPAVNNIVAQVFTATPTNRSRYYGSNTAEFSWTQAGTALSTVPIIHFYRVPEYTLDPGNIYDGEEISITLNPDPVFHGEAVNGSISFELLTNCKYISDVIIGEMHLGPFTPEDQPIPAYQFEVMYEPIPVIEVVTDDWTYNIVASAGANGTISPVGTTTRCYHESVAYTLTADQGFVISELFIDEVSVPIPANNIYTFTLIDANHTINVTFEPCPTYDINYTIVGGGALVYDNTEYTDAAGTIMICQHSDPEFDFVPDFGWEIQAVYIDGNLNNLAASGHFMFNNLSQDHDIQIVFKLIDYTITATSGPYGTIAPIGNVLVPHGTNKQFDFIPATGYEVNQVFVDNVENPAAAAAGYYTFTNVMENHTIHVTYKKITLVIHLSWTEGGELMPYGGATYVPTGTHTGDVYVTYNDIQMISFAPEEGYKVSMVYVNGEPYPNAIPIGSYTFYYITEESWLHVTFEKLTYPITSKVYGNGMINPLGTTYVTHGANKTYTFYALPGHEIANVFIDGIDNEIAIATGTHTFENVTSSHTIDVVVVPLTFTITATAGEGGFITPNGEITVSYGDFQFFTFAAASGYEIDQVLVDGVHNEAALQNGGYAFLNIDADHTITIECKLLRFKVESVAGPNGTIDPEGIVELNYGEDVTYTIIADEGYKISYVLVNGNNMGEIDTYTFAAIDADGTIEVFFEIEEEGGGGGEVGIDDTTLAIGIYSNTNIVYIVNEKNIPISNVYIFDMYGRVVWQGQPQNNQIALNVANGIYTVRVNANNSFTTKKVNIQR